MPEPFENPKDYRDIAPYSRGFAGLLGDDETIVGMPVVTVTEKDGSVSTDLLVVEVYVVDKIVFARLSGGIAGCSYTVTYEAMTSDGNRFNRSAKLKVADL